ncbi:MAG: hypothetical protein ISS72_10250, partial [Candidatus Brocadiae bacterium]|nr:hypothetical protein [Candidatus Brocadiia bacterium]
MGQKATWQERVDAAIAEGKLWRAKEILQGNLRTRGYDLELYERFGQVLLEMGDTLEAGKYLFLSGVRCPEYDEAIELYLSRYARKAPRNLVGTFPRSARRANVADYPEAVRRVLRDLDTGAPGTAARPGGIPRRGSA